MRTLASGLVFAVVACAHPSAQLPPMEPSSTSWTTSHSTGSAQVVAGSALLLASVDGIGRVVYSSRLGGTGEPPTAEGSVAQARVWLEANRLQLAEDLALGTGPAIQDLATVANIAPEHRPAFARALQRHRADVLPGAAPTVADAARIMSAVGTMVLDDPALSADGEAFVAQRPTR